jgi:peptidyl-prolyl cis-trans isomerase C
MLNPTALRRAARRAQLSILVAALVAAVGGGSAAAAEVSPALAESPNARLTLADYEAEIAKLPAGTREQFAANRARLLQLINGLYLNRLVANEARATGLDRDPIIAKQLEVASDRLLAQARFEKLERDTGAAFDANPDRYLARAREVYVTQADKYRTPEKIRVSHLMIRFGPGGEDAAKARAEELRAKVAAGTPLADLAREFSDDPSAKTNGGDLGFITAKDVEPDFWAVAFALKTPGELGPVAKSATAYHVIQFRERQAAAPIPFDKAKAEILAEIRKAYVASERTAFQTRLLNNPEPKINETLIEKLNADARAAVVAAEPPPPKKAPRR